MIPLYLNKVFSDLTFSLPFLAHSECISHYKPCSKVEFRSEWITGFYDANEQFTRPTIVEKLRVILGKPTANVSEDVILCQWHRFFQSSEIVTQSHRAAHAYF